MRPLTKKAWKRRFADALYQLSNHDAQTCESTARLYALEHGSELHVWSWPDPIDEAEFEVVFLEGCEEHIYGLTPQTPPPSQYQQRQLDLGDIIVVVDSAGLAYLPEHLRPPFLVNGRAA